MRRPEDFFAEVAGRLRAVAARPNYRFKRTSRAAAARYLERQTHFAGFSEPEILAIESFAGAPLPRMYRGFLAILGRSSGDLFCGSDLPGPDDFPAYQRKAQRMLVEEEADLSLPPNSVVILNHLGEFFAFLQAAPVPDGPVLTYQEGDSSFVEAASSFEGFVETQLAQLEGAHEGSLASTGFFLTVYPDGSGRREYPSLDSGVRPLDREDDFID